MMLLADMGQQPLASARRVPASARATGRPLSQRSLVAEGASRSSFLNSSNSPSLHYSDD